MPKILHISDTHIPLTKRHDEYRTVFNKIYDIAKQQKVDFIVHTGDLFHTKIQLTPEAVSLAVEFLKNLSDIAPLHMICGNHDVSLRSNIRLDSITPIVEAINSDRIHYYKQSGIYETEHVVFAAFSMLDANNYPKIDKFSKPIVGLYHGSISGVVTDAGYVIQHGDCDVSIFEGCDYVLLGDIHRSNQKVDDDGRLRYVGSTIQQNFGEEDNQGVMIWDIQDKDNFHVTHYRIPCPKPFITLELDEDGNLDPTVKVVKGARIRLVASYNLTADKIKKGIDLVKKQHKPESVSFVNKSLTNKDNLKNVSNLSKTLNLRDLQVQEDLIGEFLKEYNPDNETLNGIHELNKKFTIQAEQNEEVGRNVEWRVKSIEWDNLFSYGEGNRLDYNKLKGVAGLLGKNAQGKTSCGADVLTYALFNTTTKNNRKNLNVINQNRDYGRAKATIEVDGNEYVIERTSTKYTKKSKGVETVEAKTDVTITASDETNLNGVDRNDTDKVIRRLIGTVDDFMLTSLATQFSAQAFIEEGSTNRKAILAKFLDLDIFETKFKAAKSEAAEIKALLKKLEGSDYDELIGKLNADLHETNKKIEDFKTTLEQLQIELNTKREELYTTQAEVKQIAVQDRDATDLWLKKNIEENNEKQLIIKLDKLTKDIEEYRNKVDELNVDINVNIEELLDKKATIDAASKTLEQLKSEQRLIKQTDDGYSRQIAVLGEVPCGSEYSHCKFIKDAYSAKLAKPLSEQKLVQIGQKLDEIGEQNRLLDASAVEDAIRRYNNALSLKNKYELSIKNFELEYEKNNTKLQYTQKSIKDLEKQLEDVKKDQEILDLLKTLKEQEANLKKEVVQYEMKVSSVQNSITTLYRDSGYLVSSLEKAEEDKAELLSKRKEYAAYDLYLKAMHPNGISYQVIKNKLPIINEEINKVLAGVVDFSVFLLNDDDKLDIMIKYPNYDARQLDMGSGAEKMLASIAIRLALLNVTSLPKTSIMILDEPGTSFDADNLSGFIRILDLIKSNFSTVILISHLDALKEAVDMQINIDKRDGYAYVNN